MNKPRFFALSVLMSVITVLITTSGAVAQLASPEQARAEMSIGSPDAPVTLYEYASLTCPHCANFHNNTLPLIKKNYVDTGKVRIVFGDFPLGQLAAGAVMIARCSGPERFADFNTMLYQTQENWARSENPLAALIALARFYGLSNDDVMACLNDKELLKFVQNNLETASAVHNIKSTPSFVLDGELLIGANSYESFQIALDKALAKQGIK